MGADEYGETLLKEGKVGAILVAGGQGTRLGFDHPKGMFQIGPVSGKSLFQLFCEQIAARSSAPGGRCRALITAARMKRRGDTFRSEKYFGLDVDDVVLSAGITAGGR